MSDAPPVAGLAHINLRGPGPLIERLRAFYVEVIGLHEGPRPAMRSGSRGHWLYAGDRDVLHLSVDANRTQGDAPPPRAGLDHVALACRGLDAALKRLREAGIDCRATQIDDPPQVQLFVHDPAGTRIELNFADESLPDA